MSRYTLPFTATSDSDLERSFSGARNRRGSTYISGTKNSVEIGFGYTFSNGHPLSANSSQMICKCDPVEFSINYNTGKAFTVGKEGNVPTTTWYTDLKLDNEKFVLDYDTGNVALKDGSLTMEGLNDDFTINKGNIKVKGDGKIVDISGNMGGIKVSGSNGFVYATNLSSANGYIASLSSVNLFITTLSSANSFIRTLSADNEYITNLSAVNSFITNLSSVNSFITNLSVENAFVRTAIDKKLIVNTTVIDCSLGNYFEYNTTINSQNFVFVNVPQTPNTVYKCTLKCIGSVTTDNFPTNVKWSRRSFYYIWSDYIRDSAELNGDGNSDTHIITFTTWDRGITWYADDAKYAN